MRGEKKEVIFFIAQSDLFTLCPQFATLSKLRKDAFTNNLETQAVL